MVRSISVLGKRQLLLVFLKISKRLIVYLAPIDRTVKDTALCRTSALKRLMVISGAVVDGMSQIISEAVNNMDVSPNILLGAVKAFKSTSWTEAQDLEETAYQSLTTTQADFIDIGDRIKALTYCPPKIIILSGSPNQQMASTRVVLGSAFICSASVALRKLKEWGCVEKVIHDTPVILRL